MEKVTTGGGALAPSIERNRLTCDGERRSDMGAIYLTLWDAANVLDLLQLSVRAMNEANDMKGVGGANYGLETALGRCSATLQDVADAIYTFDR